MDGSAASGRPSSRLRHRLRCALALGVALLLGTLSARAQVVAVAPESPASIPAERFFQYPKVLQAALSPSGRRLALTTAMGAQRVGLMVIELAGRIEARSVASYRDEDITSFHWVGDDRIVFSVTDLQEGSGEDDRIAPGLFSVKADGTELRQLVQRRGEFYVAATGSLNRRLEWNHIFLHAPSPQPGVPVDEVVIGQLNFGPDGLRSVDPLWLDVRTGRTRSMNLAGAPEGLRRWWFDSKGQPRVGLGVLNGMQRVAWRGPGDATWKILNETPLAQGGLPFVPFALDDNGQLYVTQPRGSNGESVLTRFDFTQSRPEAEAMVRTPGFDFSGSLILDRVGAQPLGVRIETDAEQTVWFDPGMKRLQAEVDQRFPGRVNTLNCRRCGEPDQVVLLRSYADRDPGSLWLHQAQTGRWQLLSTVLEGIEPRQMASVDLHRIKARDGRELPVWLTVPQGVAPGKPAPAVVLVHGGPWVRGGHWRWSRWEQFLASRGYLVISPEFRGSTGYGSAHYHAGRKQWGRKMQDDVADALLWARKQGLASDHACIAGASYGGYATLMGLVRHPELYRCGVAWVAVADLNLLVRGSWRSGDDVSSEHRRHFLPDWVGDPDKDAAMLREHSPVEQAPLIRAPLLLGMGEADRRVPLVHGERLRDAMKAAGNPPAWVTYPNEGHQWRLQATHADFARRMEQFLARHLKPGP